MASALLELSWCGDAALARKYLETAVQQIRTLSTEVYRARPGTNGNFIQKHSVGSIPGRSKIDVPLTYADYYFLEALMRLSDRRTNLR